MKFFTTELSGSQVLTINAADGAAFVSVQCDTVSSGSCNVSGDIGFKNLTAIALTLSAGQGINLSALSPASPLDGITITNLAGICNIVIGF
jgi:hypothetical protein